jgi:CDP-diacylglycerol--glycerol-3-phosphate 3-phosphatidyltransferase
MAGVTIYTLKPRFQALLRPAVGRLAALGITANQVTLAALFGSLAVGVAVVWNGEHRRLFLLLPAWLFLRMALNAADGMLAREFGQKSRLGAYLNELGDVVSDAALYAPFAFVPPFAAGMVALVIGLAILSEFAGVLALGAGASRRYDGPLGKSDRAFVFGALGLWLGIGLELPGRFSWLLALLAGLLILTTVNRVRGGLAEAAAGDGKRPN